MSGVKVTGITQVVDKLHVFDQKTRARVAEALDYTITRAEGEAKQNAPWTDRTGNARNSITGVMLDTRKDILSAALFIGMFYGVYLELSNEGKYRIIWPTIAQSRTELLEILRESPEPKL